METTIRSLAEAAGHAVEPPSRGIERIDTIRDKKNAEKKVELMRKYRNRRPDTILIVDNEPSNIALLRGHLEAEGYHIESANRGEEALEKTFHGQPKLVLLDVLMPGMNGFEICRKLKDDPRSQLIPVIFVTALQDHQSKIEGIKAGADDFLSKPVDDVELLARCRSLLRVKHLTDDLLESNAALRKLEDFRDDLNTMVVHDIRNMMTSIMGSIDLAWQINILPESLHGVFQTARENCTRLLSMADDLLDINRMESDKMPFEPQLIDLAELFNDQMKLLLNEVQHKRLEWDVEVGEQPLVIEADAYLLERVLLNLLGNAVRYSPLESRITLTASMDFKSGMAQVSVFNEGEPIAPEHHALIFEKFKRLKRKETPGRQGVELGLAFCKLAIEAHDGRIWVESPVSGHTGVAFHFTVPLRAQHQRG